MSRIIPWNLPSVAGGSIGGYTPAPTPEEPEDEIYLKFKDTVVFQKAVNTTTCPRITTNIEAGVTGVKSISSFTYYFDGLETVSLVGVSSINVHFKGGFTRTEGAKSMSGTYEVICSVDPETLVTTFSLGSLDITSNTYNETVMYLNAMNSDSMDPDNAPYYDSIDLYVYNGNGEIIQNTSLEVGE